MKKDFKTTWTAKGAEYTHLLFTGGKLFVPDAQHATFLNEYSNAIARGRTEYVVESITPVFRLFVDFDFKPPPSPDIVDAAIKSACGVAAYYFDDASRAIVLRKNKESPEKIGVHLTWDSIYVNSQTATSFRSHLVAKLEDACPDIPWKSVVDAAVYRPRAGSLRLPWSSKPGAPGVYIPTATCTPDGTLEPIAPIQTAAAYRTWIRLTSVRAPDAVSTKTCIVTSDPIIENATSYKTTSASVSQYRAALDDFQKTLPAAYADQKCTGIHRYGDHCVILRSSSKWCGNKQSEHHTSTVYFVVVKKGHAFQRCYCRKDELRESGVTCTDYISPPWPVPKSVAEAFWPPVSEDTAKLLKMLDCTRPVLKRKKRS
jgi:hypothetical protein